MMIDIISKIKSEMGKGCSKCPGVDCATCSKPQKYEVLLQECLQHLERVAALQEDAADYVGCVECRSYNWQCCDEICAVSKGEEVSALKAEILSL